MWFRNELSSLAEVSLYFFDLDARWGWVINATLRSLYPRERPSTHCIGGWVGPRARLDGWGKSRPNGTRSPDRPARSEPLYRLSYRGPKNTTCKTSKERVMNDHIKFLSYMILPITTGYCGISCHWVKYYLGVNCKEDRWNLTEDNFSHIHSLYPSHPLTAPPKHWPKYNYIFSPSDSTVSNTELQPAWVGVTYKDEKKNTQKPT